MKEYCGDCAKLDLNQKEFWGERYYCTQICKYKYKNDEGCTRFIEKPDNGYKPSGCYITTIVCLKLGYKDDCEFLKNLRYLRENYLRKFPQGINLLHEYDIIGPVISEKLANAPIIDSLVLMDKYIIPASNYVIKKEYKKATILYKIMVEELKAKYYNDILKTELDYRMPTPLSDYGKGRLRIKGAVEKLNN